MYLVAWTRLTWNTAVFWRVGKIQANICQCCKDILDDPDEEMKADIRSDIEAMMKQIFLI